MAERGFQTELWTDPFIQSLSAEAKLLFIYLWTNKHCNQASLYEITLKTMAFDTGLSQESLTVLLKQLEPKVAWFPERNLVWVKNFLKRQCKSNSFLIAAARCLKTLNVNSLVKEFINYNQNLNLAPLYQDSGGTVVPPSHHSGTTVLNPVPVPVPVPGTDPGTVTSPGVKGRGTGEKRVVKGEERTGKQPDPAVAGILAEMKSFLGYPASTEKDPIPNYAREGQFLKKMLGRHFTRNDILSCWKSKVRQRRGEFVSLAWVNEDIAAYVHRGEKEVGPGQEQSGRDGRVPTHEPDGIAAMRAAGWSEDEPDESGKAGQSVPV